MNSALISDNYRKLQEQLHDTGTYGGVAVTYAPLVTQIINRLEVTHLLDYGCGSKMALGNNIKPEKKITYQAYDPGVAELAGDPIPAQMVACIDVLEHIEPESLDNVLDHLASLTEIVAFLTVHTGPALKVLADGRNAHLIQEPMEWWLPKIWSRFDVQTVQKLSEKAFYVIAYAKPRLEAPDGTKLT
jgi:hypothetical protein